MHASKFSQNVYLVYYHNEVLLRIFAIYIFCTFETTVIHSVLVNIV